LLTRHPLASLALVVAPLRSAARGRRRDRRSFFRLALALPLLLRLLRVSECCSEARQRVGSGGRTLAPLTNSWCSWLRPVGGEQLGRRSEASRTRLPVFGQSGACSPSSPPWRSSRSGCPRQCLQPPSDTAQQPLIQHAPIWSCRFTAAMCFVMPLSDAPSPCATKSEGRERECKRYTRALPSTHPIACSILKPNSLRATPWYSLPMVGAAASAAAAGGTSTSSERRGIAPRASR